MATGSDGALWFTSTARQCRVIKRITTSDSIVTIPLTTPRLPRGIHSPAKSAPCRFSTIKPSVEVTAADVYDVPLSCQFQHHTVVFTATSREIIVRLDSASSFADGGFVLIRASPPSMTSCPVGVQQIGINKAPAGSAISLQAPISEQIHQISSARLVTLFNCRPVPGRGNHGQDRMPRSGCCATNGDICGFAFPWPAKPSRYHCRREPDHVLSLVERPLACPLTVTTTPCSATMASPLITPITTIAQGTQISHNCICECDCGAECERCRSRSVHKFRRWPLDGPGCLRSDHGRIRDLPHEQRQQSCVSKEQSPSEPGHLATITIPYDNTGGFATELLWRICPLHRLS